MAKDKFLRFQTQRKEYLRRFDHPMYKLFITDTDLVLKEMLLNIEVDILYSNKELLRRFKHRYSNFYPYCK